MPTPIGKQQVTIDAPATAARWYRQPVLWLAALVFALFVAASAATIVLAARHADEPLAVPGERVLKLPADRAAARRPDHPSAPTTTCSGIVLADCIGDSTGESTYASAHRDHVHEHESE